MKSEKYKREIRVRICDKQTAQEYELIVSEEQSAFIFHADDIRMAIHEKLDIILNQILKGTKHEERTAESESQGTDLCKFNGSGN